MRQEPPLSRDAAELLEEIEKRGAVTVFAFNLVAAAELILAGYAIAHDGGDGPWVSRS